MKNQYFGDINDYRKYGLLRALCGDGLSLAVCWMLTADDGSADGRHLQYLDRPLLYRPLDPPLFDFLDEAVRGDGVRDVERIESSGLLGEAVFHRTRITDDLAQRAVFFAEALDVARGRALVFFDPDNGLEVKSVPPGRRGSCKYLCRAELAAAWEAGHSLLVYQHFPRVDRRRYLRELAAETTAALGATRLVAARTSHVAFLLLPQPAHAEQLDRGLERLRARWSAEFAIDDYVAPMLTSTGCGDGSWPGGIAICSGRRRPSPS
ncbi:MAG: hypothetical protein SYC29_11220 [Planctomycetota bacterium]|nr:hypothetical protein [Planctomycetota bacterium]